MAIRDLSLGSATKPAQHLRNIIVELSRRVHPTSSILLMEISSSRQVRSLKLLNSMTEITLDIDCAARILDCPWVTPIGILPTSKDCAQVFTIDSNGLVRDPLRVTDLIRNTFSPHV